MMIEVTLNRRGVGIFKKIVEAVIEGTEIGMLCFDSEGFSMKSVDALWVCQTATAFHEKCFKFCNINQECTFFVDLRCIHEFLRGSPTWLKFKSTKTSSIELSFTNKHIVLDHHQENLPDPIDRSSVYKEWPNFTISSHEWNNIVLDLSVGGTEIDITICPDSTIVVRSEFETGWIEHKSFNTKENHIVDVHRFCPDGDYHSGKYIVKFLKTICTLSMVTDRIRVYVQEKKNMVIVLSDKENLIKCTFGMRPYTGPRGDLVCEPYRKYALSIT